MIPGDRNCNPAFCDQFCFGKLLNVVHVDDVATVTLKESFFRSKDRSTIGEQFLDQKTVSIFQMDGDMFILGF